MYRGLDSQVMGEVEENEATEALAGEEASVTSRVTEQGVLLPRPVLKT